MILTITALEATAGAVADHLGPMWRTAGDCRSGEMLLIDETTSPLDGSSPPMYLLRPIFGGATVALHLTCQGVRFDRDTDQWTKGRVTWNTGLHLAEDTDPAEQIATTIRTHLIPATIRKPRHIGDTPWDNPEVMAAEVTTPTPAPPTKRRTRKAKAKQPTA